MREKIIELMGEIAEAGGLKLVAPLLDDTVLLESGLDSLGFAVLVTRLEEYLGYDPFTLMEEPVYPRTLGDFVAIYERYRRPS
jgi:hypothetical protein